MGRVDSPFRCELSPSYCTRSMVSQEAVLSGRSGWLSRGERTVALDAPAEQSLP